LTYTKSKRPSSRGQDSIIPSRNSGRPRSPIRDDADYDDYYESRWEKGDNGAHNIKRGGSLLDRLSLDMSGDSKAVTATSFGSRADISAKRSADEVDRNGDAASTIGQEYDTRDGGQETTSKASRTRRRGGKPRRPRKGGQ
jgi:hypothetical protein